MLGTTASSKRSARLLACGGKLSPGINTAGKGLRVLMGQTACNPSSGPPCTWLQDGHQ
jgi:hypothetical protein